MKFRIKVTPAVSNNTLVFALKVKDYFSGSVTELNLLHKKHLPTCGEAKMADQYSTLTMTCTLSKSLWQDVVLLQSANHIHITQMAHLSWRN